MRSAVSVGASAAESIAGGKTNEAQCKPGVPSGFFGCCELRILAFFAARATYCLLPQMPTWRNWQTRWTQNPVLATVCGFDPLRRHSLVNNWQSIDYERFFQRKTPL